MSSMGCQSEEQLDIISDLAGSRLAEIIEWYGPAGERLKDRAERLGIPYCVACLVDEYLCNLRGLM